MRFFDDVLVGCDGYSIRCSTIDAPTGCHSGKGKGVGPHFLSTQLAGSDAVLCERATNLTRRSQTATAIREIRALCRNFCAEDNALIDDRLAAEAILAGRRSFPRRCAAARCALLRHDDFLCRE